MVILSDPLLTSIVVGGVKLGIVSTETTAQTAPSTPGVLTKIDCGDPLKFDWQPTKQYTIKIQ